MLMTEEQEWDGAKTFRHVFRGVKILSAPADVQVKLGRGGQLDEDLGECGAGDGHRAADNEADYDTLQIINPSLQTVRFRLSTGSSFSDSIVGNVGILDNAARLLGIVYGSLGQLAQRPIAGVNALEVVDRGYEPGAQFAAASVLSADTNEQVVAPASTVNGIIVWDAGIGAQANSANQTVLLAKASAPGSLVDGEVIHASQTGNSGAMNQVARRGGYRFVGIGKGLYFRSDNLETYSLRWVDYTVL